MKTSKLVAAFALVVVSSLGLGCAINSVGADTPTVKPASTDTGVTQNDAGQPETATANDSGMVGQPLLCSAGYTVCNGKCVNSRLDDNNCGGCGARCTGNSHCQNAGACSCNKFELLCGGVCVRTAWDTNNCGACGNKCPNGMMCDNGTCSNSCATSESPGTTNCNGACVDVTWDPDHCGSCYRSCSGNNIVARECSFDCVGQCVTGFLDCNMDKATDGCEVNAMNDPNNCGACGVKCRNGSCVNGVCN